jgi:hypothetical protein
VSSLRISHNLIIDDQRQRRKREAIGHRPWRFAMLAGSSLSDEANPAILKRYNCDEEAITTRLRGNCASRARCRLARSSHDGVLTGGGPRRFMHDL